MKIRKFRKIFIAGQNGMVGSALYRFAIKNRLSNEIIKLNRKDIDFLDKKKTFNFLKKQKPDIVFICAAKVGGILANNNYPVDFLLNNLEIQNNLISGCFEANIDRVIFFGSSAIP